jgi:hypothetical protein
LRDKLLKAARRAGIPADYPERKLRQVFEFINDPVINPRPGAHPPALVPIFVERYKAYEEAFREHPREFRKWVVNAARLTDNMSKADLVERFLDSPRGEEFLLMPAKESAALLETMPFVEAWHDKQEKANKPVKGRKNFYDLYIHAKKKVLDRRKARIEGEDADYLEMLAAHTRLSKSARNQVLARLKRSERRLVDEAAERERENLRRPAPNGARIRAKRKRYGNPPVPVPMQTPAPATLRDQLE